MRREAFTLHGIKHCTITDSKNKGAAGHKTEQMRRHYNHELEIVEPTGEEEGIITEAKKKGPRLKRNPLFCLVGRQGFEPWTY